MTMGVYEIKNTITDKSYIGGSTNIEYRWTSHKWSLKNNRHRNKNLQKEYDKYGIECLEFNIIEEVKNKNQVIKKEQRYLDKLNPEYNIAISAKFPMLGRSHKVKSKRQISDSNKGKTMLEESKIKMSINSMGKKNGMYGRKHTEESLKKMSESQKGIPMPGLAKKKLSKARKGVYVGEKVATAKLTEKDVLEIRKLCKKGDFTYKEIGEMYGVQNPCISKIKNRQTWAHF